MATKSNSWLLRALVVMVLLAVAGAGIWYWQHPKQAAPEYRAATVERGAIVQMVTATGQLNPVVNVQVGSQISGIITNLLVDYNSLVKKNQIIAQLDSATFEATVHQCEGDLANAKAALELAQLNASRSATLSTERLLSTADNDKAQADLHQAQAQVMIKTAALERAKVDLARCTIYAPVDGVVISRNVDIGQTVAASLSAPTIFVIANDLSKMQIDANVSEADVGGVEVSQAVTFTVDAFPYRTFHGKVIQIRNSPITVQNVVSYDTVIEVKNDDLKLKPGMTANVSIVVAEKDNVLKIPNSALRFRPGTNNLSLSATNNSTGSAQMAGRGGPGGAGRGAGRPPGAGGDRTRGPRSLMRTIYLMPDTNAAQAVVAELKTAQIKTGISDGIYTEVLEGLNENDKVVVGKNIESGSSGSPGGPSNPFGGGMRRF